MIAFLVVYFPKMCYQSFSYKFLAIEYDFYEFIFELKASVLHLNRVG
jgi:hypothetical protein